MKLRAAMLLFATLCFAASSPMWAQDVCESVSGNLVTNCGFETGDFTGWTQGMNTGFTSVDTEAFSGTFAAIMGPVGSDGTLSQLLGDNSTTYLVSFWLANDGGTPNDFKAMWNGVPFLDLEDADAFGYTLFSAVLPGNACHTDDCNSLEFDFRQDPAFWHLDTIVVLNESTVPEPGSLILLGSGVLGLAGVIRRKLSL